MNVVAKLVSFAFHPVTFFLIMPFLFVYRETANSRDALQWGIFSALFVCIGIAFVIWGRRNGIFSDMDISIKEQRYEFYTILLFFGTSYVGAALLSHGFFFPLSIVSLGIAIAIILFTFLNKYIKASNHIAVAVAFVTTVSLLYGFLALFLTIWIIPLLAWSRLVLKKHTIREMIVGGVLGVTVTIATFFISRTISPL